MAAPAVRPKLRGRVSRKVAPAIPPRSCENREQMIREAAYLRAESRGFEPGHEVEDWLAAEHEVDLRIAAEIKQGFYG